MSAMFAVLETHGKRETVDRVVVQIFATRSAATLYSISHNTGKTKYWTKCELIEFGEEIELTPPNE